MVRTVPPALADRLLGLEGRPVGHARAGETAQPLPWLVRSPSIGLVDVEAVLAEVGQRVLELDRLGLLRVGLGGRGDLELGEHEVAVGGAARAPCWAAGRRA